MVRRGRYQANPRRRTTDVGHVFRKFGARDLATLTRLGTLRHLYLKIRSVDQVLWRHAKAARRDLLHATRTVIAVGV